MNLNEATALVTGGSNGIGFAIAKRLIEAGAKVAITGRDEKRLAAAGKAIGAHTIHADVAREADVLRSYKELFQRFDHLDVLVNNAGFGVIAPLVEMDVASFEQVFATNVTGAMLMAREAARHFIERKGGHIVNIGSTAAVRGAAKGTAYYGSKFALRGMTECWRAELRQYNVRVMLVNPSEVLTDFYATAGLQQNTNNPTKLHGDDIAYAVQSALEMDDRGFITELTVFATNPKD
ncbi:MAG: short-chain dehydrogenase [Acidobacteria bacterium RIFCSPLOWO2_12_FULL_67_14]|nr:MAG: short-chain dehydrogenase [Acidobacteria bacterium RIFCSPLOWO2_02_FULL_67_21]OFW39925.1 MAG: short-chain dehydrogenase [Acidobacteria bacterium RIFCSPLOWO2_12_FULL_67_14]